MVTSVTNNGQNNGYSSLINYLRVNNVYSSEIDGTVDENGDGKIEAPDKKNSAKEWEYFFKQAERYPMTCQKISYIKPPEEDKPLEDLVSFCFSLVGSDHKSSILKDDLFTLKNIIVEIIKSRKKIALEDNVCHRLYGVMENLKISNDVKKFIISQLLILELSCNNSIVLDLMTRLNWDIIISTKVDLIIKEYLFNELDLLANDERHQDYGHFTRASLDAIAKDPDINSKIKEDRLRRFISCLKSGKSDTPITYIDWAVNEIAKKPKNNVYITAKNVLNLLPQKDSFAAEEIKTIDLVNDKDQNRISLHIKYKNGLNAYFYNLDTANTENGYILSVIRLLPEEFFKGLKNVSFMEDIGINAAGVYNDFYRQIKIRNRFPISINSIIHEIFHHWDSGVTGSDFLEYALYSLGLIKMKDVSDPSNIFYSISWGPFTLKNNDLNDFSTGELLTRYIKYICIKNLKGFGNKRSGIWDALIRNGYINKAGEILARFNGKKDDFNINIPLTEYEKDKIFNVLLNSFLSSKYGTENCMEDLATQSIYATYPVNERKYIREEMEKGNFEPAAKYLFVRFIMPFKGREFEVREQSPSLGFEEVKSKLNAWLKGHPNSVRQTTIDAINIIEGKAKSLIK